MYRSRGFTLIETLVVVAIIILLAAILLPVFETVTKRAERTCCTSNLHHIILATALYSQDNDGRIVPARVSGPAGTYGTCWEILLQTYLCNRLILICPSDPMPMPASGSLSLKHSYGINYDLALTGGYNGSSLMLDSVDQPARTVMFFDLKGAARAMGGCARLHGISRVDVRHADGANFAFAAGNVKWYRPASTLQPRSMFGSDDYWTP